MYLKKRVYLGEESEWSGTKTKVSITRKNKNGDWTDVPFKDKVNEIVVSVGYWRKANAIHKWFVDKVQEGVDDCKEYYVSPEQLKELLSICKKIVDNPAMSGNVLPTQSGFFFGGTEYDEYYMQDIKNTIEIIEKVLKDEEDCKLEGGILGDYYYQSSW